MEENEQKLETLSRQFSEFVPPSNTSSYQLSIEALVDSIVAFHADIQEIAPPTNTMTIFTERFGPLIEQLKPARIKESDFDTIKVLGRGAFGEVRLVKCKLNGEVYAMKILRKSKMLAEREAAFYKEERDVMATSQSTWITKLHFAFQDANFLFLVMEFVSGGTLLKQLFDKDTFSEEEARFYMTEIVHAIQEIHDMGYCHRDIKPENVLIDQNGHIKLADFGSSVKVDSRGRVRSAVPVGTPEYISPEVLQAEEKGASFGLECDWWAVGIILYEFLIGEVPFYSEKVLEMYGRIINHKKSLKFPPDVEISPEAKDLILKLVCDKSERLGTNGGAKEILCHPFFQGANVTDPLKMTPPFVPVLKSPTDASNFDDEEEDDGENPLLEKNPPKKGKGFTGNQLPFIGFSFNRHLVYSTKEKPVKYSRKQSASVMGDDSLKIKIQLEGEIQSLKANSEQQLKKILQLEQVNRQLTTDLENLHSSITQSRSISSNLSEVEKAKSKLEIELKRAQEIADQLKKEKMEMEDQLSKTTRNLIEQQQKSNDSHKQLQEYLSENETMKTKIEEYGVELALIKTKSSRTETSLKEKEEKAEKLDQQVVAQKKEFEQTKADMENQISILKEQIQEEKKKGMESQKSSITDLQTKVESLQTSIGKLEDQVKEKDKLIAQMTNSKTDTEHSLQESKEKTKSLEEKILKLEKEINSYESKVKNLSEVESKYLDLQRESTSNSSQLSSFQNQIKDNEKLISDLKKSKTTLTKEIEDLKEHVQQLEKSEKSLQTELNILKQKKENVENQNASLKLEVEKLVSESRKAMTTENLLTGKQEEIQTLNDQYNKLINQEKKIRIELAEAKVEIENLKDQIIEEKTKADNMAASKKELAKEKTKVELKLQESEEKVEITSLELESLKRQLETEKASRKGDSKKIDELKEKLNSKTDELANEISSLKEERKSLENELSSAKSEKKSVSLELSNLKVENNLLLKTSDENQKKISEYESLKSSLQSEIAKLSLEIDKLSATNGEIQSSLEGEKKKSSTHLKEKDELQSEISQLRSTISSLESSKKSMLESQAESEKTKATIEMKLSREIEEKAKILERANLNEQEKKNLQLQLSELNEKFEKMTNSLKEKEITIDSLQQEKETVMIKLAESASELHQKIESQEILCQSLKAQYNKEVANKEALELNMKEKLDSLQSQIESATKTIEEKEHEIKELEEKTSLFEQSLKKAQDNLNREREYKKKGLGQTASNVGDVESKKKEKKLRDENSNLQQQNMTLEKRISELDSEISKLKHENYELKKNDANSKAQVVQIQEDKDKDKGFGLFRKASVRKKVDIAIQISEKIEGYLEWRHSKGAHHKWKKFFCQVSENKMMIFEKIDYKENKGKASKVFDLRDYIFIVRAADYQYIRNVKEDEIVKIFGVWTKSTMTIRDKVTSGSLESLSSIDSQTSGVSLKELEDRYQKMQAELAKERKLSEGFTNMTLAIKRSNNSNQLDAIKIQMDSTQKKIKRLEEMLEIHGKEIETMKEKKTQGQETQGPEKEKVNQSQIEHEIKQELHKQSELLKILESSTDEKKKTATLEYGKSVERVRKLKKDLAQDDESAVEDHNGHNFKMKHYNVPTYCQHCHEFLKLYHGENEGLTCQVCHLVCHKQCQTLVNVTCTQVQDAKDVEPEFFKCEDELERKKWLVHLQAYRNKFMSSTQI